MPQSRTNSDRPWIGVKPSGIMLRPAEVVERTGLSRSQIYAMIAEERFPPFVPLSTRAVALPERWLDAFLEARAQLVLFSRDEP